MVVPVFLHGLGKLGVAQGNDLIEGPVGILPPAVLDGSGMYVKLKCREVHGQLYPDYSRIEAGSAVKHEKHRAS